MGYEIHPQVCDVTTSPGDSPPEAPRQQPDEDLKSTFQGTVIIPTHQEHPPESGMTFVCSDGLALHPKPPTEQCTELDLPDWQNCSVMPILAHTSVIHTSSAVPMLEDVVSQC